MFVLRTIIIGCQLWQCLFVYSECKRLELFLSDVQCLYLTDVWVIGILADNKHCFCFVVHFGSAMPTHIIVPLVQVGDTVDMDIVFG